MANIKLPIQFVRSATAGSVPAADKFLEGQLAINTTDRKLFTKVGTNVVSIGHGAGATINGNNTWTGTVKANRVETSSQVISGNASINTFTASGAVTLNGGTNTKNLKVNGTLEVTGALTTRSNVELYHATPFIDFHFGNDTADYTHRIIASTKDNLDIQAKNVVIKGGLSVENTANVKGPIILSPVSNNNDWAAISFRHANGTTLRGTVFADAAGNIGFNNINGVNVIWNSGNYFVIQDGELVVGKNAGGTGEGNANRNKGAFYNTGSLDMNGTRAYQDPNDGNRWVREVRGTRHLQQGTDLGSENIFVERVGQRHFHMFHTFGAGTNGWFEFRNNGDFSANGVVYAPDFIKQSDKNLKKDFKIIDSALDKVKTLSGMTYQVRDIKNVMQKEEFIPTYKVSAGLIAQDVQKVLPEAVHKIDGDYLGMNYDGVTALLVNAVKELSEKVETLESQLNKSKSTK
ncbi:tail fiber domain-containing protein [Klebsiella aerogenes]|uniref:tail fiber domain-containing protein n=1 Tax=Klebsiella aerogenes TaxID=548 RepID=UPI0028A3DF31|nr:tail fiber domain-containing protein [Klebsiella aerogenes]MDT4308391.1 tail fiber domain-containing protein [Klebsiella aerogenes]